MQANIDPFGSSSAALAAAVLADISCTFPYTPLEIFDQLFSERNPLDNIDVLRELPLAVHVAAICFAVCATTLFVMLVAAPRRNCFFFRWSPEVRLLALMLAPTLMILWPIVLYWWLVKSSGIDPDDLDFLDD